MSGNGVEYYDVLSETWHEVKFRIPEIQDLKLAVVSDLIYGVSYIVLIQYFREFRIKIR